MSAVAFSVLERIRRIEQNVALINYYSTFKMPDGRSTIDFNDLVEQVKTDSQLVDMEIQYLQNFWKRVKKMTKGIK
jgi:hypothetical protein